LKVWSIASQPSGRMVASTPALFQSMKSDTVCRIARSASSLPLLSWALIAWLCTLLKPAWIVTLMPGYFCSNARAGTS
jgi:hypothetical protein